MQKELVKGALPFTRLWIRVNASITLNVGLSEGVRAQLKKPCCYSPLHHGMNEHRILEEGGAADWTVIGAPTHQNSAVHGRVDRR